MLKKILDFVLNREIENFSIIRWMEYASIWAHAISIYLALLFVSPAPINSPHSNKGRFKNINNFIYFPAYTSYYLYLLLTASYVMWSLPNSVLIL